MPCICFANLINAKCASFKDSEIKAFCNLDWVEGCVCIDTTIWMGNVNFNRKCKFGWKCQTMFDVFIMSTEAARNILSNLSV